MPFTFSFFCVRGNSFAFHNGEEEEDASVCKSDRSLEPNQCHLKRSHAEYLGFRCSSPGAGTASESLRMKRVSPFPFLDILSLIVWSPVATSKVQTLQVSDVPEKVECEFEHEATNVYFLETWNQTAGGLMVHSQQVHKCEPEP